MAQSAAPRPLDESQVSALRQAIIYLRYQQKIGHQELAKLSGVNAHEITNFIVGRTKLAAPKLHIWVNEYLNRPNLNLKIDEWMKDIFEHVLPDNPLFKKEKKFDPLFDVFLRHAESDKQAKKEFVRFYSGIYTVYRYGANMDTARSIPREELLRNSVIIRATMRANIYLTTEEGVAIMSQLGDRHGPRRNPEPRIS